MPGGRADWLGERVVVPGGRADVRTCPGEWPGPPVGRDRGRTLEA